MSDLSAWARAIGASIRRLRLQADMTQAQLAGETFSKSYISQLERGTVVPSLRALHSIALGLGISFTALLQSPDQAAAHWLARGTTLYFLGDYDEARLCLEKSEPFTESADDRTRCKHHLLAARLHGVQEQWEATAAHCQRMERIVERRHLRLPHLTVPQCYWWGKAWLAAGNRHQAVRRWEVGLASLQAQTSPPGSEGLALLYELAQLYKSLGDAQAADHLFYRLRATVGQLQELADLSRWYIARSMEKSQNKADSPRADATDDIDASRCSEAWASAAAMMRAAGRLRAQFEEAADLGAPDRIPDVE